eukprot:CFRG4541T1
MSEYVSVGQCSDEDVAEPRRRNTLDESSKNWDEIIPQRFSSGTSFSSRDSSTIARSYELDSVGTSRGTTMETGRVFSDDDEDCQSSKSPGLRDSDGVEDWGDPYGGSFTGYRGYVTNKQKWESGHVVTAEFGVDRTKANRIKMSCTPTEISIMSTRTGERVDTIQYSQIQKIDHKHERSSSDAGKNNILSLSLKDGSEFVMNSPYTADIKAEIMDYIKRCKKVYVGNYKRNY